MDEKERLRIQGYFYGLAGEFAREAGRAARLLEKAQKDETRKEIIFEIEMLFYRIGLICHEAQIPIDDEDFGYWEFRELRVVRNQYGCADWARSQIGSLTRRVSKESKDAIIAEENKLNEIFKFNNDGIVGPTIEQCQREYDKRLRKINESRRKK